MSENRAAAAAATTGNFAGFGAPTPCSPLVFDAATGDLYVLLAGDVVTKIGSVAGGAESIIAAKVFGGRPGSGLWGA